MWRAAVGRGGRAGRDVLDDVIIGDDVAARVDDDAGAHAVDAILRGGRMHNGRYRVDCVTMNIPRPRHGPVRWPPRRLVPRGRGQARLSRSCF